MTEESRSEVDHVPPRGGAATTGVERGKAASVHGGRCLTPEPPRADRPGPKRPPMTCRLEPSHDGDHDYSPAGL